MNGFALGALFVVGYLLVVQPVVLTIEETLPAWNRFDDLFKQYGSQYGVPWEWLKAIALNESNLGDEDSVATGLADPNDVEGSTSTDGKSWGLMQVTLTTARDMDPTATPQKLNNAEYSVNLAAKYLSKLASRLPKIDARYDEWVIKSYNQGPGNTDKERAGLIGNGYAQNYWNRFQSNLQRVQESES